MEPIFIEANQLILNMQHQFLIRREFYVRYSWAKKYGYYFLGWLAAFAILNILTESNIFVTFKVVLLGLTAIAFFVVLIFLVVVTFNWFKRQAWKRQMIRRASQGKMKYWLTFDETYISFSTDVQQTNLKWEYFKYFKEYGDSIYIFPDRIYESIACSKSEIGISIYGRLKGIVEKKLKPLN